MRSNSASRAQNKQNTGASKCVRVRDVLQALASLSQLTAFGHKRSELLGTGSLVRRKLVASGSQQNL